MTPLIFLLTCGLTMASRFLVEENHIRDDYTLDFGDHRATFEQWKQKFAHEYGADWNEEERFRIFSETLTEIEHHNWLFHTKQSSYAMGLNKFSAMTYDEFQRYNRFGKYQFKKDWSQLIGMKPVHFDYNGQVPDAVDWRKEGYVTGIKDQGQCKSCWAFGAVGAIEGAYFKKHKKLLSFSEQQIVDCCHPKKECDGCNGGWAHGAYRYIQKTGGIEKESDYPYKEKGGKCEAKKSLEVAQLSSYVSVGPSGSEDALKIACAQNGPIAVAIDADLISFKSYQTGIYDDSNCKSGKGTLDHEVLVVGYGTANDGEDYWIVKNSWGTSWGQRGYILMARNKNNLCGIADLATYPIMK